MLQALILMIVLLAVAGLCIAVYLTLLHYQVEPFYSRANRSGRTRPSRFLSDASLLNHPEHTLFKIPNTLWGSGAYLFILLPFVFQSLSLLWAARFVGAMFLLLTIYFGLRIPRRVNARCFFCMVINIINGFMAALLWNIPGFYAPPQ